MAAPQEAEGLHFVAAGEVSAFCRVEIHAGVEQKDRHVLRAVAEHLQVDVGVLARGAIEDRAHQIRVVRPKTLHQHDGDAAQQREHAGLGVGLKQRLVFADFRFDLLVVGQPFARGARVGAEHLAGGLALGGGVVGAIFRDHAGSGDCDFFPHAGGIEGGTLGHSSHFTEPDAAARLRRAPENGRGIAGASGYNAAQRS